MATKRTAATRCIHDTLNTLRSIESNDISSNNDDNEIRRKRHRQQGNEGISAEEVGKTLGNYVSMLLLPKIRPELAVASVETKITDVIEGEIGDTVSVSKSAQTEEKEPNGDKDVSMKDVASEDGQKSNGEDTNAKKVAEDAEKEELKQDDNNHDNSTMGVGIDEGKGDSNKKTNDDDEDGKKETGSETKKNDADDGDKKKDEQDDEYEKKAADSNDNTETNKKVTTAASEGNGDQNTNKSTTTTTKKLSSNISPDPISIQRIKQLQSQLETLQKDVEFIQEKRANFFEKTSHVIHMYEYGLNEVVKLNDLMDAPDNFLPDE